ncbi:hypothetical protein [Olsenella sp. Marseille-P4559]|uniref:hypothetical protein n=1 Tax=Olsenella sp. Marseille-P4559 TaxID=2364795 RepID=UPI001030998E|nr:hypothetical protein [Olsenella sp. Marseille-P4559]
MAALGALLATVLIGALWAVAARSDRGASSPDPDRLEYRMPRVWPAFCAFGGVFCLGLFALFVHEARRGNPTATWPVLAFTLGFAAFAFLACAQFLSWRVSVDGWGIRVSRLLFGRRAVAWADVDALAVTYYSNMPGQVRSVTVMSGGRRALALDGMYLGGREAAPGQLLDAARRRGVPVAHPSELPPGLTPWGPARRWYVGLRPWQQLALLVAVTAAFLAASFSLLYVVGTAVGQIR